MFVTKRYGKRYETVISDDNDHCPKDNLCFGCRSLMAEIKACPCHRNKTAKQQNQGMVWYGSCNKGRDLSHREPRKPSKENSILFDANFYNLLITTLGLLLCGILTGIMWVYKDADHITPTADQKVSINLRIIFLEWSIVSIIQVIFRRKDNVTITKSFVLFLVLQNKLFR